MMNSSNPFGAAGLGQSGFPTQSRSGSAQGTQAPSTLFSHSPRSNLGNNNFTGNFSNYDNYGNMKSFSQAQMGQGSDFLMMGNNVNIGGNFPSSSANWDNSGLNFQQSGKSSQALNANVAPWDHTQAVSGQRSLAQNSSSFVPNTGSLSFNPENSSPKWGMTDPSQFQQTQAQAPSWDPSAASYVEEAFSRPGSRGPIGGLTKSIRPASRNTNRRSPMLGTKGHIYESHGKKIEIRDVWQDNLEVEMKFIRRIIARFNYIAMDTEFPGVVARPTGPFSENDYNYQMLRCNVDLLNLIQLGIAFADKDGNLATKSDGVDESERDENDEVFLCCWQFHFKFSLSDDMYAQDSIDLLKRSGIDFELHESCGIAIEDFGELLTSSGLVLMPDIHWIAFHGSYDFAYLLKVLTAIPLPKKEEDFFQLLSLFFPNVYDIKHIMRDGFSGGLNRLAEVVGATRVGPEHQAGSDSLLTLDVFFKVKEKHFVDNEEELREKCGVLHGIGTSPTASAIPSPLVA